MNPQFNEKCATEFERGFPVLKSNPEYFEAPDYIPWDVIAHCEESVRNNHGGQSLLRIAQRGGLSPAELLPILRGVSYPMYWAGRTREQIYEQSVKILNAYLEGIPK